MDRDGARGRGRRIATGLFALGGDDRIRRALEEEPVVGAPQPCTPWIFLHGHCAFFALALRRAIPCRIGMIIDAMYLPQRDPLSYLKHMYCEIDREGRTLYADVRGMTDDPDLFFGEFPDYKWPPDEPFDVPPDDHIAEYIGERMLPGRYEAWSLAADCLVARHPDWYRIPAARPAR